MIGATLLICSTLLAVNGDNVRCNGVNMRDMGSGEPFVSGVDTPEIWSAKCEQELQLGRAAKVRMNELISEPGTQVFDSGITDNTESHRPLVWVVLANGQTVGDVLIGEGLARVWTPDYEADWCGPNTI